MGDKKTFVGFGFGPIQSGLFLNEAAASGNFSRLVAAEVDGKLVRAARAGGGRCVINVACRDRIERRTLEGIELYDPNDAPDRRRLIDAIASADEMATCLPSVAFYDAGGTASVAGLIAEGLAARKSPRPTIIYAAENHNHAAALLREAVLKHCRPGCLDGVDILDTVIGKMSGVISGEDEISRLGLAPLAEGLDRAVLVEEFNRILISRIAYNVSARWGSSPTAQASEGRTTGRGGTEPHRAEGSQAGCRRGIEVFIEKDDLLPFEEAKLYGHNAIHAMIAYLADVQGLATIAEAGRDARIMDLARRAFIEESGAALIRRHASLRDPLFTEEGYRDYADDLLARMVNPHLHDMVARVGRDHARKLGYDDRLFGTMRLALQYGIEPRLLALGAAAGVISMIKRREELKPPIPALPGSEADLNESSLRSLLMSLWGGRTDELAPKLAHLTFWAFQKLIPGTYL